MIDDRRGVSTVVDVGLCLVLVGAAVLTLTLYLESADAEGDPHEADRIAETVAATTVSVEYSLEPTVTDDETGAFDDPDAYDDETLHRVAHGPSAGLLADAAVANVRFGNGTRSREGADFERAVDAAIRDAVVTDDLQVVALWRPYEGAPVDGEVTAGRAPPPGEDVDSASLTVPSGHPAVRDDAVAAAESGGYDGVATVIAAAVVEGYLPPRNSRQALEGGGFARDRVVHRYTRLATAIDGVDPDDIDDRLDRSDANASAANEVLVDALADTFAADLEARYDDPATAARSASTGEVTLVVRTWDA